MNEDSGTGRLPEDVFNDALDLPAEERAAFLDRACAGDPELHREVDELLAIAWRDAALTAPPPDPAMPRRIGKYEITGLCGSGGMGVVYDAIDSTLGRRVALKTLSRAGTAREGALERLQDEARLVAGLQHPRIAVLYALEEADGLVFFTMERVPGQSLAEKLRAGPLSGEEVARIGRQVAEGLEYAHSRHIVHRDLKPANIMLQPDGDVKLLDFGIAKALGAPRAAGAPPAARNAQTLPQGTPEYMSPEQLLGLPIDYRTDLWSLGALLHECATGAPPPPPVPAGAGMSGDAEAARLPRQLPDALRRVVADCLNVDPAKRPASATAIRRALAPGRRFGTRPALLAVGAVALAAALAFAFWPRAELATVESRHGRTLYASDAEGQATWAFELPPDETQGPDQPRVARDANGHPLGVCVESESPRGPIVRWLDARTGRTRWTHASTWTPPVNARGQLCNEWIRLVDWPGQPSPVVAHGIRDGVWYGSAVEFLSRQGRVLGTYYHPGPLEPGPLASGHGPGPVYLFGDNSSARFDTTLVPFETRTHCGCVVRLDPPHVNGQAWPWSDGLPERRDWPEMARAAETTYLVLPPPDPRLQMYVSGVRLVPQPGAAPRVEVETISGLIVRADENLVPSACSFADGTRFDVLLSGRVDHLDALLVRRGRVTHVTIPVEATRGSPAARTPEAAAR